MSSPADNVIPISDSPKYMYVMQEVETLSVSTDIPVDCMTSSVVAPERGRSMDIEKYIDKIDKDRVDSENRIREDRQQMETRIVEERRLSEERMEKRFDAVMASLEKTNEKLDRTLDKVTEEAKSSKSWIMAFCIATIIGIAGLVIAVFQIIPRA